MNDFLRLQGRSVLVTGASSGIGRATAVLASELGARVVLVARREDALAETQSQMAGDDHHTIAFDLNEHSGYSQLFAEAVAKVGPLSGMMHAAGIHATTPLRAVTAKQITELFETNVTSSLLLTKAYRSPKVRAEEASVVLMSSAVGVVGEAGVSAYAASKAAVSSLARSLALELAPERIRVNSIAAGIVMTSLTEGLRSKVGSAGWEAIEAKHPLGLGTPEDVANSAVFLLSGAAKWITGSTAIVDGGYTAH